MDRPNTQTSSSQAASKRPRLVLMWRGNIHAPDQPTNHLERFKPLIAALGEAGVEISTHVYFDSEIEAARARLTQADGVMVWINPLQDGQDRTKVDALLRDVVGQRRLDQCASRHHPQDGYEGSALSHPRAGLGNGHRPLSLVRRLQPALSGEARRRRSARPQAAAGKRRTGRAEGRGLRAGQGRRAGGVGR